MLISKRDSKADVYISKYSLGLRGKMEGMRATMEIDGYGGLSVGKSASRFPIIVEEEETRSESSKVHSSSPDSCNNIVSITDVCCNDPAWLHMLLWVVIHRLTL